ncbi:hypothetical protein GCM10009693_10380 [Leucobacter chromiireducens subsp. chromiireducens]
MVGDDAVPHRIKCHQRYTSISRGLGAWDDLAENHVHAVNLSDQLLLFTLAYPSTWLTSRQPLEHFQMLGEFCSVFAHAHTVCPVAVAQGDSF